MLPLTDHLSFHPLGPLIVLLLTLTIGPYILNQLMSFIKERLNTIQIMVLRQQYQMVAQDEEKDSSTETTKTGGKCEAAPWQAA